MNHPYAVPDPHWSLKQLQPPFEENRDLYASPFPNPESDDVANVPFPAVIGFLAAVALIVVVFIAYRHSTRSSPGDPPMVNDDATAADAAAIADAMLYPPPAYLPPDELQQAADLPTSAPMFIPAELATFVAAPSQREKQCSVCLDPFGAHPLAAGACAHVFHAQCVARWLVRDAKRSCPVCRLPFDGAETDVEVMPPLPEAYAPGVAVRMRMWRDGGLGRFVNPCVSASIFLHAGRLLVKTNRKKLPTRALREGHGTSLYSLRTQQAQNSFSTRISAHRCRTNIFGSGGEQQGPVACLRRV